MAPKILATLNAEQVCEWSFLAFNCSWGLGGWDSLPPPKCS